MHTLEQIFATGTSGYRHLLLLRVLAEKNFVKNVKGTSTTNLMYFVISRENRIP